MPDLPLWAQWLIDLLGGGLFVLLLFLYSVRKESGEWRKVAMDQHHIIGQLIALIDRQKRTISEYEDLVRANESSPEHLHS